MTESTFDAYLWQTIENKQKFISQVMTSKSPVRSCEDVDEAALSYAEIKALCAGDPRIKERMELDTDVARLRIMRADHQNQQFRMEDSLMEYPRKIADTEKSIAALQADMEALARHPHLEDGFAGMVIHGVAYRTRAEAGNALLDACTDITEAVYTEIGSYRGFVLFAALTGYHQHVLTLKNAENHRVELGQDPRGNIARIDNALAEMPEQLERQKARLANLQQQMEATKAEIGKPFPREEELQRKSARLAELDAQLNIGQRDGAGTAAA